MRFASVLPLALIGTACGIPQAAPGDIVINEIRVADIGSDGLLAESYEVEVHLFDQDSGRYIGCAGENTGLGDVSDSNATYTVSAWFQSAQTAGHVQMDDVRGQRIEVVVIENDDEPCPVARTEGDLITSGDDHFMTMVVMGDAIEMGLSVDGMDGTSLILGVAP